MKKVFFFAITLFCFAIFYSCSKDSGTTTTPVDPGLTYAKDIAPIMSSYCTSCHGSSGGVNLSTKATVISNLTASINAIQRGSMPPGSNKVSAADLTKLKSWDRVQ